MLLLSRHGTLTVNIRSEAAHARRKATIELPADAAERAAELYDQVFDFAFDVLGVQEIELRVRRPEARQAA